MVTAVAALLVSLSSPGPGRAQSERSAGDLPVVGVRIVNDTDARLSLTISSPCGDRALLRPGQAVVLDGCLRWGLVYHVRAVFWTDGGVLERQDLLFLARPGQDWVFHRRPTLADHATVAPGARR